MNFNQKLVYMLVGSLFTIAGYLIASLPNNQSQDAHAQENANNVFDEIVCKKLLIVDNNGKQLVKMGEVRGGMEAGKEGEGGYIFVYNNEEMAVVGIDTVQQGHGTISVTAYLINILVTYVCKQEVQNLNNFQRSIPIKQLNADNPLTN